MESDLDSSLYAMGIPVSVMGHALDSTPVLWMVVVVVSSPHQSPRCGV